MIIYINSLIFFKNFLPPKGLAKYFLRARLAGSTTFCTSDDHLSFGGLSTVVSARTEGAITYKRKIYLSDLG